MDGDLIASQNGLVQVESGYSVDESMKRLQRERHGVPTELIKNLAGAGVVIGKAVE